MEKLRSKLKKNGKEVLFIAKCLEPADGTSQNERIVVFTNQKLEIYTEEPRFVSGYSWNAMTKAKFPMNAIFMSFGEDSISLNSEKITEMQKKIIEISQSMLTNVEMHVQEMYPFSRILSKPTISSALSRMINKAESLGITKVDDAVEKLKEIYQNREQIIDFSEFSHPQRTIPLIVDAIQLFSFVSTVILQNTPKFDIFSYFLDFALKNIYIEYVKIEGDLPPKFTDFLNSLKQNTAARIGGITFFNTKFTPDQLTLLSSTIAERDIPAAGFNSTFADEESVNNFYDFFLSADLSKKLKKLCVYNSPLIRIDALMSKLSGLSVLSLHSCGLEIYSCFSILHKTKLKIIDLSGNKCSKQLPKMDFPFLSSIILRDVEWGDNTLSTFFIFVSRSFEVSLSLDLSDAKASADEWVKFFMNTKKYYFPSIREFKWENNPIHPLFFDYLKENDKICSLSMSGCFSEEDVLAVDALCNYLMRAPFLKKLVLVSNEVAYLGKFTVPILSALLLSPGIEYLDISCSKCGNSGVCQMNNLLKNSTTLNTVHFDGSDPTSCSSYADLLGTVIEIQKKRQLAFAWPETDMLNLLNYHKLRHSKFDSMKAALTDKDGFLYRGNGSLDFTELTCYSRSATKKNKIEISDEMESYEILIQKRRVKKKSVVMTVDPSAASSIVKHRRKKSGLKRPSKLVTSEDHQTIATT